MEQPSSPARPKHRRSRNGCRACRRVHRKCDEQKPSCGRCLEGGKQCSYQVVLSWGGRPFTKSSFGELQDIVPIQTVQARTKQVLISDLERRSLGEWEADNLEDDTPFVYGVRATEKSDNEANTRSDTGPSSAPEPKPRRPGRPGRPSSSKGLSVWSTGDWLIELPAAQKLLLHHFLATSVTCIVLNKKLQFDFCSAILPMALDGGTGNPLLAAILSTAAAHRKSRGLSYDEVAFAYQKQHSLRQLGRQLTRQLRHPTREDDIYIATSLTLCFCEILEGGEKPNSWRAHLKGAAALLGVARNENAGSSLDLEETPSRTLLRRWWQSYEGHALHRDRPVPLSGSDQRSLLPSPSTSDVYIDDFHGFSVGLLSVIDELNLLIVEKQAIRGMKSAGVDSKALHDVVELRANRLVVAVRRMLETRSPRVHGTFDGSETSFELSEFFDLDEAYHHTTLLKIYQRVLGLQATTPVVQRTVRQAIDCINRVTLHDFACPGAALLQPLFTTGCETHNARDREAIITWLDRLRMQNAMGNVDRAKEFLLELWERRDSTDAAEQYVHWNDLLESKGWELALY